MSATTKKKTPTKKISITTKLGIILIFVAVLVLLIVGVTGSQAITLSGAEYAVYSPDGRWLITVLRWTEDTPIITVWDTTNYERVTSISNASENNVEFRTHSQQLFVLDTQIVEVWDTVTWTLADEIDIDDFICDGEATAEMLFIITCGSSDRLVAINLDDSSQRNQIVDFADWDVNSMSVSPQGIIAVALYKYPEQYKIAVINPNSQLIETEIALGGELTEITWTFDNRHLIGGDEQGVIHVWDASIAEIVTINHGSAISSVDVSYDNRFLVAGGEQSTELYCLSTAEAITQIDANQIRSVRFSPDETHIVTASWDVSDAFNRATRVFDVSVFLNDGDC